MRLARLLHSAVSLIAAGGAFDANVLKSIESASSTIIGGNRDATDAELLGLENLIDQLVPASGGSEESAPPNAEPVSEPSGDTTTSVVNAPEAGGDSSPQEPESVTAVAPPAASAEAPAEPLTEVHSDPLADELFQPQPHDEDDGA